jgi:hypothetical protein
MHGSVPQVRFPLFHQHDCLGILWAENTARKGRNSFRRNWVNWQAQLHLGQSVIIEPGGGKSYLAPSRNA